MVFILLSLPKYLFYRDKLTEILLHKKKFGDRIPFKFSHWLELLVCFLLYL